MFNRLTRRAIYKFAHIGDQLAAAFQRHDRDSQLRSYLRGERRPWSPGYSLYKWQFIGEVLNDPARLTLFRERQPLPAGYGFRLDARVIEIPWVLSHLQASHLRLLDAGSSLNHEAVVKAPALQNRNLTILTLAPEHNCFWKMGISYHFGDLRDLVFRDEWFDAVMCISTIEHVGMDNTYYTGDTAAGRSGASHEFLQAVKELRRVLKPGGILYITFPFGQYEYHGWFQQFDAAHMDELLQGFYPARFNETIYKYNPDGWALSSRAECADCSFFDVRKSRAFDPSSAIDYPSDYPAGERAVACLELYK